MSKDAENSADVQETAQVIQASDPGPDESPTISDPPDGGLRAWLQVLCGHLIVFNVWGYINSFGIFQSYYATVLNRSSSDISWVGSLQIFFVYFLGTFSGRATDAGYLRLTLTVGLFLQVLGTFMTSISSAYWHLILAQGVCQGIGDGLVFCPIVAVMSTYFTRKRTMAISTSASGAATGGLVFPAIAQNLLSRVGFGWTVRVMGFVLLFNSIVVLLLVRQRLPPRKTGPFIEWKAFTEMTYTFFAFGMFFCFWAVYYAYDYVSIHSPSAVFWINGSLMSFILGSSIWSRYSSRLWVYIIFPIDDYEWTWSSGPLDSGLSVGSVHWSSEHVYPRQCGGWDTLVLLDCSPFVGWALCFRGRLRFLRRWCSELVPIGITKPDQRPEQSWSTDWDGFLDREYRFVDWASNCRSPHRYKGRAIPGCSAVWRNFYDSWYPVYHYSQIL